ncbi:hypothetical protein [Catenulispora sp. EB89]|uniref:hypothetical protein n=1 Tax=Catenulispora sp. EB89 TaxID=3156257 RepID=UPI003510D53A
MVTAAEQFDTIRNEVTTLLSRLYWEGGYADEFRHHWDTVLADRLAQVEQWLRGAGFILRINAAQQRQASEGFGGSAGGSGDGVAWDQDIDKLLKVADISQFPFTFPKELEELAPKTAKVLYAGSLRVAQYLAGATTPDELKAVEKNLEEVNKWHVSKWHVSSGFAAVDLVFNVGSLMTGKAPTTARERDEAADHQVNAVLDGLSLVPGPQQPVFIAATVAYEAVSLVDPHVGLQIEHGVRWAATSVVDSAVFAAESHVHAAEAVNRIISRGVGSVLGSIHL